MGGFQDLESMQWRWFWLEGCVNFLKWVVNGNCNDSPTPCTPLNNDAFLLLYPGIFFCKISQLWSYLSLSLQVVFCNQKLSPTWIHAQNPIFHHPLFNRRHTIQARLFQGCHTDYVYSS